MKEHSEAAWKIASQYSNVLASETRDLAAQIDAALDAEREKARHIRQWLRGQANAEKDPKAKAAFVEAHNAALAIIEGRA